MAVTVTNTERDGDLCVATFNITSGGGDATTTNNVVGHIKQIEVTNTSGISNSFTMVLEDTANNMQLFSGTVDQIDLSPTDISNGSGVFCRGPLKFSISGTAPTATRTVKVYYEKM